MCYNVYKPESFCSFTFIHNSIVNLLTPQMYNIHWLPIRKQMQFKVVTLTYKVLSTQQPAYLSLYNLISYHQPSRLLRSSSPAVSLACSQDKNRLWTSCFLLCCSTNLELSYTYCYQSLIITWLLQMLPRDVRPRGLASVSRPNSTGLGLGLDYLA